MTLYCCWGWCGDWTVLASSLDLLVSAWSARGQCCGGGNSSRSNRRKRTGDRGGSRDRSRCSGGWSWRRRLRWSGSFLSWSWSWCWCWRWSWSRYLSLSWCWSRCLFWGWSLLCCLLVGLSPLGHGPCECGGSAGELGNLCLEPSLRHFGRPGSTGGHRLTDWLLCG